MRDLSCKGHRRFLSEAQITRLCYVSAILALVMYGVATQAWMLYVPMALLGASVGGFAVISSLCSQVVPHALVGVVHH